MKGNRTIRACFRMLPVLFMLGACTPGPTQNFLKKTGDLIREPFVQGALSLSDPDVLVLRNQTSVYASPNTQSTVQGTLLQGEQIQVLTEKDGWVRVSFGPHRTGWVCTADNRCP